MLLSECENDQWDIEKGVICRVCLCDNVDIRPCGCNDGFHKECFKQWFAHRKKENGSHMKCEVCLCPYENVKCVTHHRMSLEWFCLVIQLCFVYALMIGSGCTSATTFVFLFLLNFPDGPLLYLFMTCLCISVFSCILMAYLSKKPSVPMCVTTYDIECIDS